MMEKNSGPYDWLYDLTGEPDCVWSVIEADGEWLLCHHVKADDPFEHVVVRSRRPFDADELRAACRNGGVINTDD
mgnify:CR=1 FL=1